MTLDSLSTLFKDYLSTGTPVKDFFGTGVPILGGLWALLVYMRDAQRKRVELFRNLRDHYRTNPRFGVIFRALAEYEKAEPTGKEYIAKDIKAIDIDARLEYVAFLEDVALIANSRTWRFGRVLPEATIHYMFGYSAIQCWETEPFWEGLFDNKSQPPVEPGRDTDADTLQKFKAAQAQYKRDKAYWCVFESFVDQMKVCREKLLDNPKAVAKKLNI